MSTDKYVWSENEEMFNSEEFDTIEEALEDAKQYIDYPTIVYIGKVKEVNELDIINASRIIDDVREAVYEQAGEVSEDFLDKVTDEQEKMLKEKVEKVFYEWLKETKNIPSFFAVRDIKEFNVS